MDNSDREYGLAHEESAVEQGAEVKRADLLLDLAALDALPQETLPPVGQLKRHSVSLAFTAGLLLGWLLIGWWLWPVRWANCGPWDLRSAHQRRFVALVAAEHWRTGDAGQAAKDLAGWDAGALSALLVAMENEAPHPEARESLAALRKALALSDAQPSLWTSLFEQKAIMWSMALAALLLVAAVALAIVPRLLARSRQGQGEDMSQRVAAGQEVGALQPWLEAFENAEEETPVSWPAPESELLGEDDERSTKDEPPRAQVRTFIQMDDPATEQDTDRPDVDEAQGLLSNLFEGEELSDRRLDALNRIIEDVPAANLVKQARGVLEGLRQLQCLGGHEEI